MALAATSLLSIRRCRMEVRVRSEQTGGSLCVMEHRLEPGVVAMPLHRRLGAATLLQVSEGALSVQLEGAVHRLGCGELLAVAPGAWHTFWNAGDETVRLQEIAAPGGLDAYYAAVAALVPSRGAPDVPGVVARSEPHGLEVDMDSLMDLVARHQVHLA